MRIIVTMGFPAVVSTKVYNYIETLEDERTSAMARMMVAEAHIKKLQKEVDYYYQQSVDALERLHKLNHILQSAKGSR